MIFTAIITLVCSFITAASSLFLAILTIWRGPKKGYIYFWAVICLAFFLFSLMLPLAQLISRDSDHALGILKFSFVGVVIIAMNLFPFIYSLTEQLKQKLGRVFLAYLTGLPFLIIFLVYPNLILTYIGPRSGLPFYPHLDSSLSFAYLCWTILAFSLALLLVLRLFLQSKGILRVQLKYMFVGFAVGIVGGLSTFFPLFGLDSWPFVLPMLFLPFFSIVITYGIVKHRLMDLNLLLSRALGYFLTSGAFLAVYAFFVFASESLLKITLGQNLWLASGVMMVLIAFLFEPFRSFTQKSLYRIFSRGFYEYPKVVLESVETLVTKLKIEDLLKAVADLVAGALGVRKIAVLLPMTKNNRFYIGYSNGIDTTMLNNFSLTANEPILGWLRTHNQIFILEQEKKNITKKELSILISNLSFLPFEYLVPLVLKDRLLAVLALGAKESSRFLSDQDIDLLKTISKQAAVALENAQLYQEISLSQSALLDEKQRTEAVISSLLDGLVMVDKLNNVVLINPAAEQMLGVHADLILGNPPNPSQRFLYQVLMSRSGGGVFEIEIFGPPLRILRVISAPVKGAGDESLGTVNALHDVTRERIIDQMKSEFISIASHRFRTPLSALKWSLSMLLQGDVGQLSNQQEELLKKSFATNEHMIHLVNDLLNVSKIEEGKIPYQYQRVQIIDKLREVVDENQSQLQRVNLRLNLILPDDEIPEILADSEKIKSVLEIIIDNAVKYTLPGGQIDISVKQQGQEIEICVADTGVGIPKNQQSDIFTKFFRGANVVRMQTEGTGLGLFLAKTVVEEHGGRIWFESKEGKGSKFFIVLPIKSN
ncbi:MAG: hypothetical protein COU83_02910 [Candidatus Portnoybacteria bacterium CG10_big_fil_rev_8_21_14_0_10_40_22]|uniref:histidine kinase n=1 Tax=Candidatus Portnoybacteria bacterium CG10_big_fil_rev_8_21_14_0_10_40_22 TaxID=1974814 RepID=A0A2M8KFD0_9BACT|nr:MAG: hypothetical protein AUJ33_02660 [Parcubacteria group bacterium CG1_02_40_25]PJE58620.1 MAG: hypothetical protein COU83_02910 [Candidatus Portnoybacteria bacterium CG10_big_fil_rev_8_21_14_0_10_40_22]